MSAVSIRGGKNKTEEINLPKILEKLEIKAFFKYIYILYIYFCLFMWLHWVFLPGEFHEQRTLAGYSP